MATSLGCNSTYRLRYWNFLKSYTVEAVVDRVATVPTVYGIETLKQLHWIDHIVYEWVATVPTVYGIETLMQNVPYQIR